jgi:hypothetical protein
MSAVEYLLTQNVIGNAPAQDIAHIARDDANSRSRTVLAVEARVIRVRSKSALAPSILKATVANGAFD